MVGTSGATIGEKVDARLKQVYSWRRRAQNSAPMRVKRSIKLPRSLKDFVRAFATKALVEHCDPAIRQNHEGLKAWAHGQEVVKWVNENNFNKIPIIFEKLLIALTYLLNIEYEMDFISFVSN